MIIGILIGIVLPYIVAGIIMGARSNDWKQAGTRVLGMLKATFGALKTGIDQE